MHNESKNFIFKNLILLLLLVSCNKTYDQAACEDLAMKKFKGFTDAKKKFADNCTSFKIEYTEEKCQAALNDLILNNDLNRVKTNFGDRIETCFTEQDLKKYNRARN